MQNNGHLTENAITSDMAKNKRNALMEEYFRTRIAISSPTRLANTVILSEEYPCPKAYGKKGKLIWDLTIDSYRADMFKKAYLPILENYVLLALEVQRLRGDIIDNGFFKYKPGRHEEDEPVMVMRTEANQFLNLSQRMITMFSRLGITHKYDSTQIPGADDPAKKLAEQEQILIGSQSNRSHLMGRGDPEDDDLELAA